MGHSNYVELLMNPKN